jgi:hypothetical protein
MEQLMADLRSHDDMNDMKLRRFNGIHKNSMGELKFGHWNVSKSRIKKMAKFLIKEESDGKKKSFNNNTFRKHELA